MPGFAKTLLAALLPSLLATTSIAGETGKNVPEEKQAPTRISIPEDQAYAGAYIDFGLREDTVSHPGIRYFDRLVGRKQAIIGFSSDWGNRKFLSKQLAIISSYGAVPLIYWSPWDRPIGAPEARNLYSLHRILAGELDAYIEMWAIEAAKFGKPMLVAWGLEMNGQWFPWSGTFYGAGSPVPESDPPQFEGPATYKKAYRYVVDKTRRAGASNIEWVFHANNTSDPASPWNAMGNYYPGDEYVDWLGMSAYGQQYPDQGWAPFEKVIPGPYRELTALHPDKPVILAEWGIGEFPRSGSKAAWLEEAFRRIPVEFPRIKAAVIWHEQWRNGNGLLSNLKVNSSAAALAAYRKGIAGSFWLDRPLSDLPETPDMPDTPDP